MKFQEIKNNVFYCGLNDCDRRIFDELIPLEHGTSYNSYLVKGSEKTAIIDTMYPPKTSEYVKRLDENKIGKVDYIIANHGEQDHSGQLQDYWKNIRMQLLLQMQNVLKILKKCFMLQIIK